MLGSFEVVPLCDGWAPLPLDDEAPGHDVDWDDTTVPVPVGLPSRRRDELGVARPRLPDPPSGRTGARRHGDRRPRPTAVRRRGAARGRARRGRRLPGERAARDPHAPARRPCGRRLPPRWTPALRERPLSRPRGRLGLLRHRIGRPTISPVGSRWRASQRPASSTSTHRIARSSGVCPYDTPPVIRRGIEWSAWRKETPRCCSWATSSTRRRRWPIPRGRRTTTRIPSSRRSIARSGSTPRTGKDGPSASDISAVPSGTWRRPAGLRSDLPDGYCSRLASSSSSRSVASPWAASDAAS